MSDVAGLLAAALAARDDEEACGDLVERLWDHPDHAEVRAAVEPLLGDPDVHVAEVAIDVYSVDRPEASEEDKRARMARILALLDDADGRPPHWRIAESIAYAFLRLWQEEGAGRIAAFAGHPEVRVRTAVAHALAHADDPAAVAALVALSADADEEIRDWATFGLGANHSASRETPEVTAALVARLEDPYLPARDEAIHGLAIRRDARAAAPLLALFDEDADERWMEESLVLLDHVLDDPRLPVAIAAAFPDGVPQELRSRALRSLESHDQDVIGEDGAA